MKIKEEILKEAKKIGVRSVLFDEENKTYRFPLVRTKISELNPTGGRTDYFFMIKLGYNQALGELKPIISNILK